MELKDILRDILKRHGAALVLRPYDFRLVVKHTGGIPLLTRPEHAVLRRRVQALFRQKDGSLN